MYNPRPFKRRTWSQLRPAALSHVTPVRNRGRNTRPRRSRSPDNDEDIPSSDSSSDSSSSSINEAPRSSQRSERGNAPNPQLQTSASEIDQQANHLVATVPASRGPPTESGDDTETAQQIATDSSQAPMIGSEV